MQIILPSRISLNNYPGSGFIRRPRQPHALRSAGFHPCLFYRLNLVFTSVLLPCIPAACLMFLTHQAGRGSIHPEGEPLLGYNKNERRAMLLLHPPSVSFIHLHSHRVLAGNQGQEYDDSVLCAAQLLATDYAIQPHNLQGIACRPRWGGQYCPATGSLSPRPVLHSGPGSRRC